MNEETIQREGIDGMTSYGETLRRSIVSNIDCFPSYKLSIPGWRGSLLI